MGKVAINEKGKLIKKFLRIIGIGYLVKEKRKKNLKKINQSKSDCIYGYTIVVYMGVQ